MPGDETCQCGNVFNREMQCDLCRGKCLGLPYVYNFDGVYDDDSRPVEEECTHWGNCNTCCCECDGCFYHEEQYRLPEPIPRGKSCLSSCSCGKQ